MEVFTPGTRVLHPLRFFKVEDTAGIIIALVSALMTLSSIRTFATRFMLTCALSMKFRDEGELGYPCIRIPSIQIAGDGLTLNAFAECRNFTGDGCEPYAAAGLELRNANRDICQKQSKDNGTTWSALKVIVRVCTLYTYTAVPCSFIFLHFFFQGVVGGGGGANSVHLLRC